MKLEGKETIVEIFEQNMDNIYTETVEKLEIEKEIASLEEELYKTLSKEQLELLNEINQRENMKHDIVNRNVFVFAYSLATKSIIEGLK